MTHRDTKTEALPETASGSLERITFSPENDGEKSLLTLIEERRPRQTEDSPRTPAETRWDSHAGPPDDLDDDEAYRLDHSLMRLGGNGF